MHIHTSVAILFVVMTAIVVEAFVPVTISNQCSDNIELVDNNVVETVAPGGTAIRRLADGFRGTFRNGVSAQATLAEFSVAGGLLLYGINITPPGASINPDCCASLDECKAVTGTMGYNTPMKITTTGCTSVTCLEDGCPDAYHFPTDNTKAHACVDTTSVVLTFCPNDTDGLLQQQQQQQQYAPVQTAPTLVPSQPSTLASTPCPASTQPAMLSPTLGPTPSPTLSLAPPVSTPLMTTAPTPASSQPSTLAPTPAPTTKASDLTIKCPSEFPAEVSIPPIVASKSTTAMLTETPNITSLTFAGPNLKPSNGDQKIATVSPTKEEPQTGTATVSVPTTATATSTASAVPTTPDDYASVTSASLKSKTGTTTTATPTGTAAPKTTETPVAESATSSKSNDINAQTANTQSSKSDGSGASTYVATGLGSMAVVAILAVVVVAYKKKQDVGKPEEEEYNQEDVMTPVTQINVL